MNEKYVKETCKPGTTECCRYLLMGSRGWECAKLTDMKNHIDFRADILEDMRATGDNCAGITNPA
jgi:hypothetical protein